jgi:hypothetical protein
MDDLPDFSFILAMGLSFRPARRHRIDEPQAAGDLFRRSGVVGPVIEQFEEAWGQC